MAYRRRLRTVLEWVRPRDGMRILDAGSGRGFTLKRLHALSPPSRLVGLAVDELRACTHRCFPFEHFLVYGIGRPLLERGLLPRAVARAADRADLDAEPSPWNPVRLGTALFSWFDRGNAASEPPGRSTV